VPGVRCTFCVVLARLIAKPYPKLDNSLRRTKSPLSHVTGR